MPVHSTATGAGTSGRTRAEIDLGAVRHNVKTLERRAKDSRLMAVVKADAYGHGATEAARACIEAGADSLAVVTVQEGAELRRAGLEVPILIFTDLLPDKLPLAAEHRLAVTAHSIPSAKRISTYPDLTVHLKVNTGMNRWGVEPAEVAKRQIYCFDSVLAAQPFGRVLVHAANSAATLWHPRSHYDLVRPGVALYGLHPAGDTGDPASENLRPAMALTSYVAAVRRLAPGDGVSYGLTYRAGEPMFAATVPVGYAEGYRRALAGRAEALIRGRRRPLLGRVTMDACVFGVDAAVEVGDEVVLLGTQGEERIGAEELGSRSGTINYEITTGVNPRRVERSHRDVRRT